MRKIGVAGMLMCTQMLLSHYWKGITMTVRNVLVLAVMTSLLGLPVHANSKGDLQQYLKDTAHRVKSTEVAAEKRAILTGSIGTMSRVLDILHESPSLSHADVVGIERLRTSLRDKQNQLTGTDGYVAVPDEKLNAFAEYVVQDAEQADQVITISLVTLLVGIIVLILLLR
jgi:hypothetical protein